MLLREASDAEKLLRDRVTASAWGERLTVDQFVAREVRLRSHQWARENMQTWFWVDEKDRVLSSCETFCIASEVGGRAGLSWGIASVFTEAHLRKRGHSTAMLQALNARLASLPHAQSAVLYSDVGAPIYERSGYRAASAFDLVLPAVDGVAAVETSEHFVSLEPLRTAARHLQLLISDEQLAWHVEREHAYAELLGRAPLPVHSASLEGSVVNFAASLKTNELVVLQMRSTRVQEQRELLKALQAIAFRNDLQHVIIWSDPLLPDAAIQLQARDGSLPMFAAFDASIEQWSQVERGLWL